jgi:CO/xanthine dehydrogenase FAD-binding subunit
VLSSKSSSRTVDLADFYTTDGIVPFAMESNELLKKIIIPTSGNTSAYHRLAYRSAIDYPIPPSTKNTPSPAAACKDA